MLKEKQNVWLSAAEAPNDGFLQNTFKAKKLLRLSLVLLDL